MAESVTLLAPGKVKPRLCVVSKFAALSLELTQNVWQQLVRAASIDKRTDLRAFMLFRPSGGKPFNRMTEAVEIPVRLVKPVSDSGPIFRWAYEPEERTRYYPKGSVRYTNRGTAIIQPKLEMTLHYAFWMGTEYGISGSGGFHLNLWRNKNGKPLSRAYYVNGKGKPCTDGEFWEIPLTII